LAIFSQTHLVTLAGRHKTGETHSTKQFHFVNAYFTGNLGKLDLA
jgi:hypothetical protein